jgi:hypothetical protein
MEVAVIRTSKAAATGVAVALMVATLVTACSSGTTQNGAVSATASTADSGGSSAAAQAALAGYLTPPASLPGWPALNSKPPEGKKVYYINSGSAVGQIIANSIREACDALGWHLTVLTYSAANLASANSDYLTAVNAGGNVIISTGLAHNAIATGLAAAKQNHVVVIQIQSGEDPATTPFYNVDNNVANRALYGKVLALAFIADAEEHGTTAHVGVVTTSGIPVIYAESTAERNAITEYCRTCTATLINVPVTQVLGGQAAQAVISFIQRNPATNYLDVAGPIEAGMRATLDAAGLARVRIGGFQPTPAQNTELKTGGSQFWLQLPYGYEGWLAVDTAARVLTGSDPAIHNTEQSLLWLVTRQNLDFDTSTLPDFPAGYQAAFKKLWHVAS